MLVGVVRGSVLCVLVGLVLASGIEGLLRNVWERRDMMMMRMGLGDGWGKVQFYGFWMHGEDMGMKEVKGDCSL